MKRGAFIPSVILDSDLFGESGCADGDGRACARIGIGATGEAILRARAGGQTEIEVGVKALKPDSVHRIWAAQEHSLSAIGANGPEDSAFHTAALGEGHFAAVVSLGLPRW